MAQTPRETAIAALFARLVAAAPFNAFPTQSRRLRHWRELVDEQSSRAAVASPVALFPALYVVGARNLRLQKAAEGLPAAWVLETKVYLYNRDATPGAVVETVRNSYLDALEAAIAPDPSTGKQSLGGLVRDVRLGDEILTDEGVLGEIGLAIVPVLILLTK